MDWANLARALDIGKTMLHYLKTEQREPSPKVIRKLEILETCEPGEPPLYADGPIVNLPCVSEPGPQWPSGETPVSEIEERIEKRFQALEGKMDAIFIVLSELRNAQKSDFRSSENPKVRYPKGHE